jgi:type I restriction enzyme, S subunit
MDLCEVQGWKQSTLGSVATFINGYAFAPDEHEDSGLPVIRIEQLKDRDAPTDRSSAKLPDQFLLHNDDIVFSWSGSFMVQLWDRGPAWLNQHLFRVIPKDGVNNSFLAHLLNWSIDLISRQSHGTTMTHVTRRSLLAHNILLPPLQEQCRIAEILDTLDEEIQASTRVVGKLQTLKAGLVNALPHQSLGSKSIGEVTEFVIDGVHHTPYYQESGVPFITVENLTRGSGISFAPCRYISAADHRLFSRRANPRGGDILVSNADFHAGGSGQLQANS